MKISRSNMPIDEKLVAMPASGRTIDKLKNASPDHEKDRHDQAKIVRSARKDAKRTGTMKGVTVIPKYDMKRVEDTWDKLYGGNSMKENTNLVKNLRRLLETEVMQAEAMIDAKEFSDDLQEMVEKIGRLQNEKLPPVTSLIRETYGAPSADAFHTQIYGALQGVMNALYTAKTQVDDAVSAMAHRGQVGVETDMEKDINNMGDEGPVPDLDNVSDEFGGGEMDDELGDDESDEFGSEHSEEPLGRGLKTEAIQLQRKVLEMRKLVAKARSLKEARK